MVIRSVATFSPLDWLTISILVSKPKVNYNPSKILASLQYQHLPVTQRNFSICIFRSVCFQQRYKVSFLSDSKQATSMTAKQFEHVGAPSGGTITGPESVALSVYRRLVSHECASESWMEKLQSVKYYQPNCKTITGPPVIVSKLCVNSLGKLCILAYVLNNFFFSLPRKSKRELHVQQFSHKS